MVKAELLNMEEIGKLIRALPKELGQYAISSSTLSAATVVQKAIKQASPRSSKAKKYGHLSDNIKKKRTENANLATTYTVYVPRKIFWAKWVEEGTVLRPAVKRKPGQSRRANLGGRVVTITDTGRMPARPFFKQAFENSFPEARRRLQEVIWDRTQKAIKNLSGKFGKYKGRVSKRQRIF